MSKKEAYQQKIEAQVSEWKADIDKLRARAAGETADAKLKLEEHIEALEAMMDTAKSKLVEVRDSSEEAWEVAKDKAESAWTSIKSGFQDAVAKIKA